MDNARINKAVGAEIRAARARRGWSREELSKHSGVTVISIRRYESGSRAIPVDVLVQLATVLGLDMDDIQRAIKRASLAPIPDPAATTTARNAKAAAIKRIVPRTTDIRKAPEN